MVVINDQYVKNVDSTDYDYFGRAMIAGLDLKSLIILRLELNMRFQYLKPIMKLDKLKIYGKSFLLYYPLEGPMN